MNAWESSLSKKVKNKKKKEGNDGKKWNVAGKTSSTQRLAITTSARSKSKRELKITKSIRKEKSSHKWTDYDCWYELRETPAETKEMLYFLG